MKLNKSIPLIKSKWLYLLLLSFLIIYAYSPFIRGNNYGAIDALIYQYALHDALIQLRHGIFPSYISQSEFHYFGVTFMRAPYYLLFGQLLDTITFHQFNALQIQHLMILVSALGGGLITYLLLNQIMPKAQGYAFLLSFLYITCPGVMGLIYILDMYFSFMALPFLPLMMFGLIRVHQKNDITSHIITATGLSLILMAHPPIAFWCFLACGLFYLFEFIFFRRSVTGLLIMGAVIFLLNLWQIVSVFELGLIQMTNDTSPYRPGALSVIHGAMKTDLAGVFFPLNDKPPGTSYLQLGYSLWFILLSCMLISIRSNIYPLRYFLIIATILILYLFPIPYLSHLLWDYLPFSILQENLWPMQRIHMVLAAIICFIGMLTFAKILPSAKPSFRYGLILLALIGCMWNIYQMHFFVKMGESRQSRNNFWIIPENIYAFLQPTYTLINAETKDIGREGTVVPQLKSRLLNEAELPIADYDNEQVLTQQCLKTLSTKQLVKLRDPVKFPLRINTNSMSPIFSMDILGTDPHLFLCLSADVEKQTRLELWTMIFLHSGYPYAAYNYITNESSAAKKQVLTLPIYNLKKSTNNMALFFKGNATINSYKFMNYDLNTLPIHVKSLTPYKASVETKLDHVYLDMYKSYYPGYQAKVNGEIAPILQTKHGNIKILLPNKGKYQIELEYIGTRLMHLSFYVSALAWLILFTYFICQWRRQLSSQDGRYCHSH